MTSLAAATWTEVADGPARALVVPIGSCEQHGPHLPLHTDTVVAHALAEALAVARPDAVLVAPAIAIAASGEHTGFPGTLSIGTEVMALVLVELARSADWARGVVLVNGHGGNADAVARAVGVLQSEGRSALAWWPPPFDDSRADAHAGWLETSLIAHLSARELRPGAVAAGNVAPLSDLAAALRKHGVHSVSATGVLGDPTGWSAADGARLFATMTADLVARFDAWLG